MKKSAQCLVCSGKLSKAMRMAVHTKHGNSEVFAVLAGRQVLHSNLAQWAVEAELEVRVCKECGYVMPFVCPDGLHDVSCVDTLGAFKDNPKKHPLYSEYLKEDHSYKSYDGANLVTSFGRWMEKRLRKERL